MYGIPICAIVITSPETDGIAFPVGPVLTQVESASGILANAHTEWPASLKL